MMLALAMVLTLIPAMGVVAQAAEVIFKTNMEYSVAIDGNLLELIPKDENRPEDAKHIVKIPENTEYITIIKGESGYPNIVYKGNGITDGETEYEIFDLPIWTDASYDSVKRAYTIPVKDIKDKAYLTLLNASGKKTQLYLYKEAVVVPPEENVKNAISAFPSPEMLTLDNKAAVEAARTAYDALDDAAKVNVTNYSDLVIAEKTIEVLEAKAELEQAKSDYNALKTEADQAKSDLEKAQTDLATAKTDLETANTQLETAKSELETAKTDAAATKTELETAKTDLETAQIQLEAAKEEASAAKTALAKEKAKNRTVAGLKLASKSKKITVTWKKTSGATGYQVSYKLKTAKSYTVLKTTTSLKAVTKTLKSGKVYQFKVRTYTTVSGAKVYGKWTSVKSITCK